MWFFALSVVATVLVLGCCAFRFRKKCQLHILQWSMAMHVALSSMLEVDVVNETAFSMKSMQYWRRLRVGGELAEDH